MARLQKTLKRYERHFLLGLVILLLLTFSISGAVTCQGEGGSGGEHGGTYLVAPGERRSASSFEWQTAYNRLQKFRRAVVRGIDAEAREVCGKDRADEIGHRVAGFADGHGNGFAAGGVRVEKLPQARKRIVRQV